MDITADTVEAALNDYHDVQPLDTVEEEHVELLPDIFADGDYGWRDAEWVVQWYFRRFLDGVPHRDRRAVEDAYGENAYEDVHAAITACVEGETTAEKVDPLTDLTGVDVGVASAFCMFVEPDRFLAVDKRAWGVLCDAGDLDEPYPEPPSVEAYDRYLEVCRRVAERCDSSIYDLYRTLWVVGGEHGDD